MTAYTDYPITELGDAAGRLADIRQVNVLSFDGNKYCLVEIEGIRKEIKAGYLYSTHGRLGDVECIDVSTLPSA